MKTAKERRHSQDLIHHSSMGKELWQRHKHLRDNHRKSGKELMYFAPEITDYFLKGCNQSVSDTPMVEVQNIKQKVFSWHLRWEPQYSEGTSS